MILYHGSNVDIQNISLSACRPYKDFGRGFDRTNFVDSVSRQSILSWTHYRILLQVFSKEAC